MSPQFILYTILLFITFDFVIEQVLSYLNLKNLKAALPAKLSGVFDDEKYKQSQLYTKTNTKFGFITSTFNFILSFSLILSGAFGWLDTELRTHFENPILLSLVYFGILFIASDLLHLPFSIYHTFVIEEKFGFNKMTIKTFILDKMKGYVLSIIFGGLLLGILLLLILQLGNYFWLIFWVIISLFLLFINLFYTSIVVPLFNKLNPLEDGELKSAIMEYSNKVDFPLTNIYVIDGSKRSTKANAYFSGFGPKKKIVLFDTLIKNHTKEELVAVLAHEVGHYKKKHIVTGMILSILQVGLILFLLSKFVFNANLSLALGSQNNSIAVNLIAFGLLFTPLSHIIGMVMNLISRKNEYEADAYAASTYSSDSLQEALKKLSSNNLSNLMPHPAYVFMHYSHPPLLARLNELEKIKS